MRSRNNKQHCHLFLLVLPYSKIYQRYGKAVYYVCVASLKVVTKFLPISQNYLKFCTQVEKDYTNEFAKFQVHILCGSRDIYIQKCVIFGGQICYFYISNILLASDVVCIWLLIGQSQSVIVVVIGKQVCLLMIDRWQ